MDILATSTAIRSFYLGSWTYFTGQTVGMIISGDVTGTIYEYKIGSCILFELPFTIPRGYKLSDVTLTFTGYDPGFQPTGGSGTFAKVTAEKSIDPVLPTNISDYQSRVHTDAYINYDEQPLVYDTSNAIGDITSILQEIVDLGDVTKFLVFFEDYEGRSSSGDHKVYSYYNEQTEEGDTRAYAPKLSLDFITEVTDTISSSSNNTQYFYSPTVCGMLGVPPPDVNVNDTSPLGIGFLATGDFTTSIPILGMGLNFNVTIPRSSKIFLSNIVFKPMSLGISSGVGVKSNFRSELDPSSGTFADKNITEWAVRRSNVSVSAIPWDDQTLTSDPITSPDLSEIIQETVNKGDVTGLTIFCDDYEQLSTNNYGYGFNSYTSPGAIPPVITIYYGPPAVVIDPPTNVEATTNQNNKVTITWTASDTTGVEYYNIYRDTVLIGNVNGNITTYDDNTANSPVITPGTASASKDTSLEYVDLNITTSTIENGTSYSYYVKSLIGTSFSAESNSDTGYRLASTLSYQWQMSESSSDSNYSNIDGATTESYSDANAPVMGPVRYFRCMITAIGSSNTPSNSDIGYRSVYFTKDDTVNNNGGIYKCLQSHYRSEDKEPGVGVNWQEYWTKLFDASKTIHSDLTNLQGGTINEYYHLTNEQHDWIVNKPHNELNDMQGGGLGNDSTSFDYYHIPAPIEENNVIVATGEPVEWERKREYEFKQLLEIGSFKDDWSID